MSKYLNQYEVSVEPYPVGGWWHIQVFLVNNPEIAVTDVQAGGFITEQDLAKMKIQKDAKVRMSAEKFMKMYSPLPRKVLEVLADGNLTHFPYHTI